MSEPAPPAERPSAPGPGAAARAGLLGGLAAFAIVTAVCVGIGLIEYAGSGGRYHAWTWVKVGFLYLLSSCEVALRARILGSGTDLQILYRIPLLSGTALIVWLVARAARRAVRDTGGAARTLAGAAGAALGFAVPGFLVALPAHLFFPSAPRLDVLVSPVRWEAAVLVSAVAVASAATGVFLARRPRAPDGRAVRWVEGGARMFGAALLLAFVAFLVAAALRPTQTNAYVRTVRGWGRGGVVAATHHLLLAPDQSVWLLAPWMGGATNAETTLGDRPLSHVRIGLRQISFQREALGDSTAALPTRRWDLDAAAWLFLLVPASATVLGGWTAARGADGAGERLVLGVGSGVVFAILVSLAVWMTRAALPLPPVWITQLRISAAMPSTALLALAWGVVGGALGALAAGFGPRGRRPRRSDQELAAPEPD